MGAVGVLLRLLAAHLVEGRQDGIATPQVRPTTNINVGMLLPLYTLALTTDTRTRTHTHKVRLIMCRRAERAPGAMSMTRSSRSHS